MIKYLILYRRLSRLDGTRNLGAGRVDLTRIMGMAISIELLGVDRLSHAIWGIGRG